MSEARLQALVCAVGLLICPSASARTAEQQLLLSDGQRATGRLASIVGGNLTLATEQGDSRSIAAGEWVRWGHPVDPDPRPRMHFGRRSSIVAKQDWTGKIPISIDERHVTIDNAALGQVKVERAQVNMILVEASKEPSVAAKLLGEAEQQTINDRVWLIGGDLLSGRLVAFDGTTFKLEIAEQMLPILANRVAAVALGGDNAKAASADRSYLVGLDDGSLLAVAEVELRNKQLTLTTAGSVTWQTSRSRRVVFLQSFNTGVTYLSDLEPIDFRHTPYFSGEWPLARDQGLTGGPLRASERRYAKGIAMHSASRAVYRVPTGATHFHADIALDDVVGQQGSVVYRVYRVTGDGLQMAFESGVVRGGESPRTVRVELNDCAAIVLVVDYADFGDEQDHANWLDARFR